jgi:hypothetical protein
MRAVGTKLHRHELLTRETQFILGDLLNPEINAAPSTSAREGFLGLWFLAYAPL